MTSRAPLLALLLAACSPDVDLPTPPAPPSDAGADVACTIPDEPEPCDDGDPCTADMLARPGVCEHATFPGCAVCTTSDERAGTSRDGGACCTGCWSFLTCFDAPTDSSCGGGGGFCAGCPIGKVCAGGACLAPECGADDDCAPGERCVGTVCASCP